MEKGDEDESLGIAKWMLVDFVVVEKKERLCFGEGVVGGWFFVGFG